MAITRSRISPLFVSLVFHAIILGILYSLKVIILQPEPAIVLETVLADEDREQIEIVRELDVQDTIAETLNYFPGSISTRIGGSESQLVQQKKIDERKLVEDPNVKMNLGDVNLPAVNRLGDDLGEAQVTGEIGAIVEGYGAALDRLTQELIRLMRNDKLLVVWLFDESESMKDDQQEIKKRFHRVYEELKLYQRSVVSVEPRGKRESLLDQIMLTAVTSFGAGVHIHTDRPTGKADRVLKAIDRIPVDPTGKENLCAALSKMVQKYQSFTRGPGRRKLVLVVVSDESGDDELGVESVLNQVKAINAPIYFLGRESVFGSLYAHVRWRQPVTERIFHLPVRRGPETAFAEQLQFDGYRRRGDSQMSGFGPYAQVRLARDSGGIFFQLPYEQENLLNLDQKKYEWLRIREYAPSLESRRRYMEVRQQSKFRQGIWDVIAMLNPYDKKSVLELSNPVTSWERFTMERSQYGPIVRNRIAKIVKILQAMKLAEEHLESIRPLRNQEPTIRWRANYDLIAAQLPWYRVRLFEYALGLDQFAKNGVEEIKKNQPKHNRWYIFESSSKFVVPDAVQEKLLNVSAEDLLKARDEALEQLSAVRDAHPRTPWARRAEWEMNRGFGVQFRSYYQPPPSPNPPPRPTPRPPPKL